MSEDEVVDAASEEIIDDEIPVVGEGEEVLEVSEVVELDTLEEALARADKAEKEIVYKEAEIQNVRKRMMAEKAEAIQYGGMGLARKMLAILADVDRALATIQDDDESSVAQGLRLLRNKMWHELSGDGVQEIKAKGEKFDPSLMEAITTIPASDAFPAGQVVDVLEAGYTYKSRVISAARVVVANE